MSRPKPLFAFYEPELKHFRDHWLLQTNSFIALITRGPVFIEPFRFLKLVDPGCKSLFFRGERYSDDPSFISEDEYISSYVIRFMDILRTTHRDRAMAMLVNNEHDAKLLLDGYNGQLLKQNKDKHGRVLAESAEKKRKRSLFMLMSSITRDYDDFIEDLTTRLEARKIDNADDLGVVRRVLTAQALAVMRYKALMVAVKMKAIDVTTRDGVEYVMMSTSVINSMGREIGFNILASLIANPFRGEVPIIRLVRYKIAMQAPYNEVMNELLVRREASKKDQLSDKPMDMLEERLNAVVME